LLAIEKKTVVIEGVSADDIPESILNSTTPVILKDFAQQWPIVIAGKQSPEKGADYIRKIYSGEPVTACYGEAEIKGRVFYNQDMSGFNYRGAKVDLNVVLDKLLEHSNDQHSPTMYMGSTEINRWFPGFNQENPIALDDCQPLTSMWIGNKSKIAAHYDFPQNIACSVIGKRRFTLFPPEQISNLYVGPIEFAPGGQEISLVDFDQPDFEKFPKFEQAINAAQVAELDAGDALLLPSMWWHHVEGLDSLNVLVSHWWRNSPAHLGRPNNALLLAILSLRSLPEAQRKAWQHIFNHYIFDHQDGDQDHIPEQVREMLNFPLDDISARKIRADLLNKLKR